MNIKINKGLFKPINNRDIDELENESLSKNTSIKYFGEQVKRKIDAAQ